MTTASTRRSIVHNVFDRAAFFQRYGVGLALVLLIVFNLAVTPNFATSQTLAVNLTQICTIVIVGVGMTLVIATGGIDLSVGSLMAIAGALSPMFFTGQLIPVPNLYVGIALGIVIPIMVAGMFGLFNGWLITNFNIQPIIATLVLFIAGRGIAQVSTNGDLQVFKVPEFQAIAIGRVLGVPFQVWIMLVIVAVAAFVLHRTVFGTPGAGSWRQRGGGAALRHSGETHQAPGLHDLRHVQRHCRSDRHCHELGRRRQSHRPWHGAGRHCRGGGRRHAAVRWARHDRRHAARAHWSSSWCATRCWQMACPILPRWWSRRG